MHKSSMSGIHEAPFLMSLPLVLLAFGSIFVGYMCKDMFIGVGTQFWGTALYSLPSNTLLVESEYIPQDIKMIPLALTGLGAVLAYTLNYSNVASSYTFTTSYYGRMLYTFLNKRWLFDKVYNDVFGKNALSFGYNVSFKSVDKGVLEMLGPYGLVVMFKNLSGQFKSLQTGYVYHYAFVMLIGLTFMLALVGLWDVVSVYVDNRLYFIHLVTYLIIQATVGEA